MSKVKKIIKYKEIAGNSKLKTMKTLIFLLHKRILILHIFTVPLFTKYYEPVYFSSHN